MADIIQLLPDSIANQIAAGEVIQRPASVVKELMENAVDAGATRVQLVVKEAGKSLIQVIDNGCGMSETDARMCFERHATSKLRAAKDLFALRTMGFRGEAMASIAAIARIEARTKRMDDVTGSRLVVEGSEVKVQESCQCAAGTTFSVKNLFYNVPARRNFLKSNTVEMRHIIDEFQRIALAHPDIFFSLHHNDAEMFHLQPSNLRQRIVNLLGQHTNPRLVPVEEETDVVTIRGFVGKAEFAKKARGEQFLFVNQRFIKSSYLNHAIMGAYEDLLPKGHHPMYVIFIEIDPARLDINIHPTKQEIKFDDERLVYNYLKVTVRHALAQYNITPTLDFEQEPAFAQQPPSYPKMMSPYQEAKPMGKTPTSPSIGSEHRHKNNLKYWEKLYDGLDVEEDDRPEKPSTEQKDTITIASKAFESTPIDDTRRTFSKDSKHPYQIHNTYIVSQIRSGFMLIDQQAAHERILFEKYMDTLEKQQPITQKELFTKTIQLSPGDVEVFRGLLGKINLLGFDIREFGKGTFVVNGIPAHLPKGTNEQELIESLLEQYKLNLDLQSDIKENLARSLAHSAAIKQGDALSVEEMKAIIDNLFACKMPYKSPAGRSCFTTFDLMELDKRFQ